MTREALYRSVLTEIEQFTLDGVPKRENEVHPHYGGFSITNLPARILKWLGAPPPVDNPLASRILPSYKPAYQHVILLLVDGLSLELFRRFLLKVKKRSMHREWAGIFDRGSLTPLTSIAPSTTSTALTTLWTGRLPAEHGIIGYELFLKEYGLTANMIFHSVAAFSNATGSFYRAGFDPESFLPVPALGPMLKQHGVETYAFQHSSISTSGLTRMLLKGVKRIAFETTEDLWRSVQTVHDENENHKTYSYIYWSGLDTFSNHHGPDSAELYDMWPQFAKGLANFLNPLITRGSQDTLFILTADHGQIATEVNDNFDLHRHSGLITHFIMMPTGESRLPYLFIKNGHEGEVDRYLKNHWNGLFSMRPSGEEILDSGLLGPVAPHPATLDRAGSLIVFPEHNAYLWWTNKENRLLGRHGGLSRDEMLVPFFALDV